MVLKFGGSVLRSERDLAQVVHEVYRHTRRGRRVVAVVSAFEGRTDALVAQAAGFGDRPDVPAVATLVSTGELASASTLALALSRAGIGATVLTPAALGLRTTGDPVDADPCELDLPALHRALQRRWVVVVPGFTGVDDAGNTTLLGRGGSDLTALFIAHRLGGAPCRLVKDVPGLFDRDPALPGPPARCFQSLRWEQALSVGGGVVQPKSILFARDHGLAFEVGALHRAEATVIGPGPNIFRSAHRRIELPWRVAILGAGTVGLGVYTLLRDMPARFQVVAVACRDTARATRRGVEPTLLTRDPVDAATRPCDIVVEALGGEHPALDAAEAALALGDRHVVTANKTLVALHGPRLRARAEALGVRLSHSAAVGGSAPVLECVEALRADGPIRSVRGVLNGTTNFVLSELANGRPFSAAVRAAQEAGFAEADPSRDLDGRDAAEKLAVISQLAFGATLDPGTVDREPLTAESAGLVDSAQVDRAVVRQVASLRLCGDRPVGAVRLEAVPLDDPLASAVAQDNRVLVETDSGTHDVLGFGAGRWPTAESVVADLLDISRECFPPTVGPRPGRRAPAGVSHRPERAEDSR